MSDNRKEYWNNDYFLYWQNRVNEANNKETDSSHIIEGDKKTISNSINNRVMGLLNIGADDVVLEVGCGFGRNLEGIASNDVYACDISQAMIDSAKTQFPNVKFKVSEAETTGYEDNFFDKIICIGTFDALYQSDALVEFNRILKVSGQICITGKSNSYCADDHLAKEAEVNARKKGHPNYFTDFKTMEDNLVKFGFELKEKIKFEYRGDFAEFKTGSPDLASFYEYVVLLEKKQRITDTTTLPVISSKYSIHFEQ